MHRFLGVMLSAAAILAGASPAQAAVDCAAGDPAAAGAAIYGSGTELVSTGEVAGLRTALVREPYIAPGTRQRLVRVGAEWCSAESAINRAWEAAGRDVGDGRALAAAYARLAAAPYFDQTTVTSQASVGGVHTIATHARTNGITARWVVVTDGAGVRTARWTATGFAVKPFVAEIEGLTALEGASEAYTRTASGLLRAERGLPGRADLAVSDPAATLTYNSPDGYAIHVVAGDTRQMPDVGEDTGRYEVDKATMRAIRDMVAENYAEFYGWGLRGSWARPEYRAVLVSVTNATLPYPPAKTGYVYINNSTSGYCLACVFIADDFQIHMASEFQAALAALGYSYPAGREYDAYSNILAHEMAHNWQNTYVKPTSTGRSTPGSYSEGIARFQESLHSYSDVSWQPQSLLYANDVNGCNGAVGAPPDAALAKGVFADATLYSACYFWMPWYGSMGMPALMKVMTEGMPTAATPPPAGQPAVPDQTKVIRALEIGTGRPYVESAAVWARGLITGENMTYASPLGTGKPLDWSRYLERWTPATVAPGESDSRSLSNGGIMGLEVTGAFRPSATGGAAMAVIRDTATGSELTYPAGGELVAGPAEGERVYLIATRTAATAASVRLTAGTP